MNHTPSEPRPQPQSLTDVFMSFTILALQGFGGVVVIVQREMVEKKRWLTQDEFVEDWAVAQVMPGPNVINLAIMIGGRYFGLRGALAALAGMLTVPLVLVVLLALGYARFANHPGVAGALHGMTAVAAGLIVSTGLRLMSALKKNPLGIPVCAVLSGTCFILIAVLRWPLAYALFGLGAVSCVLAYRKLGS